MKHTIKDIQKVQLSILKQIIAVCEKHKLNYVGIAGTALGAYRHKGFIPWDDDVDIAMPREDYEKFLKLQNEFQGHFIQTIDTDSDYNQHFAKVRKDGTIYLEKVRAKYKKMHHGIWVDIFPLDYYKKDEKWFKDVMSAQDRYRRASKPRYGKFFFKSILYRIVYGKKLNARKNLDKVMMKFSSSDTELVGNVKYNDVLSYDNVVNPDTRQFEDITLKVPGQIEKYLEHKYGDYMTLPPESERQGHVPLKVKL
jgi:lipopolysaccharide cholinephosphotransferase